MTIWLPTLCRACTHYRGDDRSTSFPEGIPANVLLWGHDHREPVAGEEPFELAPRKRERYEEWLRFSAPI